MTETQPVRVYPFPTGWPRLRLAVPAGDVVFKSGPLAHAPVELPVSW